ncbi:DUF58 domain-containing protein [Chloroflexus sp.]|uniref:DUF58 domain-containing protein n=1 Tax=Chloroflexus sp. TaxID=1904827 RepID=UPI00260A1FDD|nr:DUF58 domain-containing protein [uncultured Chloroflexus sp.]
MNITRPLLVLLLAGVSYLAAQTTGQRLFFHLSYILAGLPLVALAWAWLNLRGLSVERAHASLRASVGEYTRERITIRNLWWLPKLWIELQDESDLPDHEPGFVAYLGSRESTRWTTRTLCTRRGRFTLGPTRIISSDPFGLFRFTRLIAGRGEIIVYPATEEISSFRLPGAELAGGSTNLVRGHNVTPNVATIRDYQPGDGLNRIHWRSTARHNRLMVKEFELDPNADIYLILDLNERAVTRAIDRPPDTDERQIAPWWQRQPTSTRQMLPDSTEEQAVQVAASLARALLAQNRIVGLIAWSDRLEVIPAEREERQLWKILELLAVAQASGQRSLAELLVAEGQRFSRDTTLIIITSDLDPRWITALQHHLYRGARAAVIFIDPLSYGGWHDPTPLLNQLTGLKVDVYRLQRSDTLADALRQPLIIATP